jgi:hypothetical protein
MDGRMEEEGEVLGKPGLAGEGEVAVTFQVRRSVDARRRSVHRRGARTPVAPAPPH